MKLESLTQPKPGEKIIYLLRRHPIIFVSTALEFVVLLLLPGAIYWLFKDLVSELLLGAVTKPTLVLATSAYYLLVWLFFMTAFVDYYLDLWVITTDKIINVEQQGLFNRTVSELDLAKIQDVTSEVHGILPSIFGYGDVLIQTAGEVERFDFEQIPQPDTVRGHILELAGADLKKQITGA